MSATTCPECDGLGVVRSDWYITHGANDEQPDGGRISPADGER